MLLKAQRGARWRNLTLYAWPTRDAAKKVRPSPFPCPRLPLLSPDVNVHTWEGAGAARTPPPRVERPRSGAHSAWAGLRGVCGRGGGVESARGRAKIGLGGERRGEARTCEVRLEVVEGALPSSHALATWHALREGNPAAGVGAPAPADAPARFAHANRVGRCERGKK